MSFFAHWIMTRRCGIRIERMLSCRFRFKKNYFAFNTKMWILKIRLSIYLSASNYLNMSKMAYSSKFAFRLGATRNPVIKFWLKSIRLNCYFLWIHFSFLWNFINKFLYVIYKFRRKSSKWVSLKFPYSFLSIIFEIRISWFL